MGLAHPAPPEQVLERYGPKRLPVVGGVEHRPQPTGQRQRLNAQFLPGIHSSRLVERTLRLEPRRNVAQDYCNLSVAPTASMCNRLIAPTQRGAPP